MELLWTGAGPHRPTLVLGHSAGSPMDSPWMTAICDLLAVHRVATVRFEFSYMAARRAGARRPPPKAELSMGEYRDAVAEITAATGGPALIGGKSYGGRVASMVADELFDSGEVTGLVCLGYPFHPPERPEQLRTAHLLTLRTPALICQGTKDPFGGEAEVPGYGLPPTIDVRWFAGPHDVQPRTRLGAVADVVAEFAKSHATAGAQLDERTRSWLAGLGAAVPELASVVDEHLAEEDLLIHVAFADIGGWQTSADAAAIGRLLAYLEHSYADAPPGTRNAIAVSYVENQDRGIVGRFGPC